MLICACLGSSVNGVCCCDCWGVTGGAVRCEKEVCEVRGIESNWIERDGYIINGHAPRHPDHSEAHQGLFINKCAWPSRLRVLASLAGASVGVGWMKSNSRQRLRRWRKGWARLTSILSACTASRTCRPRTALTIPHQQLRNAKVSACLRSVPGPKVGFASSTGDKNWIVCME